MLDSVPLNAPYTIFFQLSFGSSFLPGQLNFFKVPVLLPVH